MLLTHTNNNTKKRDAQTRNWIYALCATRYILYFKMFFRIFSKVTFLKKTYSLYQTNLPSESFAVLFLCIKKPLQSLHFIVASQITNDILYQNIIDDNFYPIATSKIIMIVKPKAKAIVPILECFPAADSGINSSTTT